MKSLSGLLLALCPAATALAQENRDDLTPLDISYTTTVAEDRLSLHVEMTVQNVSRPSVHLSMPAWSPGAYRIGNYGRRVDELRARGAQGIELEITQMDPGSWSIETGGQQTITVGYDVPAPRRGRFNRGQGAGGARLG